jgi:CDP-diglyceride synthetase
MGRRIISDAYLESTKALESTEGAQLPADADGFWDKVIKNIPGDVVAGWTAVLGLFKGAAGTLPDQQTLTYLWILFGIFLVAVFVWTFRQTSRPGAKPAWTQIILSTIAFFVWALALGTPFDTLSFYDGRVAAALLIVYTIAAGAVNPPE